VIGTSKRDVEGAESKGLLRHGKVRILPSILEAFRTLSASLIR
jgi:hypothetical protein